MMKHLFFAFLSACVASLFCLPCIAEPALEELFPPSKQDAEVERKALSPDEREQRLKDGISEAVLDLYGDVIAGDGYGAKGLTWGQVPLNDLGSKPITYDTRGMRKLHPPPPGAFPRMFFTDADREEHLHRLEKTQAGQKAKRLMDCMVALLKGTWEPHAEYNKPDVFQRDWHTHGYVPMQRLGDRTGKAWNAYVKGEVPFDKDKDGNIKKDEDGNDIRLKPHLGLLAFEAFRCWLEDDREAARTAIGVYLLYIKTFDHSGGYNGAYCLDFLGKFMTEEERALVLSHFLYDNLQNVQYGCFQNADSTTSNWASFSYRYFSWALLDAHPQYNELMYRGYVRGMHNFLTYGWFEAGPCFEGMGKNTLGGEIAFAMARRGDHVIAHPHLLANVREYTPHSILPWGNVYYAYDKLGGIKLLNPSDFLPIKYLFPDDPLVDYVYRQCVFDDYSFIHTRVNGGNYDRARSAGWRNDAFEWFLFMTDYDSSKPTPEGLGLDHSFIGPQRGLMVTRSDWGEEAVYMHHHVRGQSGGHVSADRNAIVFAADGQLWFHHFDTVVDIYGTDGERWKPQTFAPGKMIDYKRGDLATFSCGDASFPYNHQIRWLTLPVDQARDPGYEISEPDQFHGWVKNPYSFNDFALQADAAEVYNRSIMEQTSWIHVDKAGSLVRANPETFVRKAMRSAGVVRGAHPYGLIVDDIAADEAAERRYAWSAILASDIVIKETKDYESNGRRIFEVILENGDKEKVRKLAEAWANVDYKHRNAAERRRPDSELAMVFIQADGERRADDPPAVGVGSYGNRVNHLKVPVYGTDPQFKVLLIPRQPGDPEHQVRFVGKDQVQVKIGEQVDTITFKQGEHERTGFKIDRAGGESYHFGWDSQETSKAKLAPDDLVQAYKKKQAEEKKRIAALMRGFDPNKMAGMTGYYSFDRITDDTLQCRVNAAHAVKMPGAVATQDAVRGNALDLKGTKVTLPDGVYKGPSSFAISCWLKDEDQKGLFLSSGYGPRGFRLLTPHDHRRLDVQKKSIWFNAYESATEWTHFVLTVDDQRYAVYMNGIKIADEAMANAFDKKPLLLGDTNQQGQIDELRVFERALTKDEVEQLFHWDRSGGTD